jgi:ribonuclease HII
MPSALRLVVCGVDEAGRGPLAGPVYAAAVILDPVRRVNGLADSKVLTAERRDLLAGRIKERAIAWAVASASVEEIDAINIFRAALLAMRRAVEALSVAPQEALIDGTHCPDLACRSRAIVDGDASHKVISAASILAKTARDAEMARLHERYPLYGFDRHKGYSTPEHLESLRRHGPCDIHRRSFEPVRVFFEKDLFSEG